jgi:CelD/BcsL family acetyltransferase involved in cellulose biosynthesis
MDLAAAGFGKVTELEAENSAYSVEIKSDLAELEVEWRALEKLPQISVHQSFDWCNAWARHSGHQPLIIVGRSTSGPTAGRISFILPMCVERCGPVRIARYM